MKKFFLILIVVLAVAALAGFVFQEPLKQAIFSSLTSDMFLEADNDAFDPGIAVGATLPPIAAMANGQSVTDVRQFGGTKGTVLLTNRSVDW